MRLLRLAVTVLLAGACDRSQEGATALADSLENVANEMIALHEPRRVLEYHDRSGKPFWIAFIPPHAESPALTASGIPPDQQCPSSDLATVAVGGGDRTQCVTFTRMTISDLRAVHKSAGTTVQITIDLDQNGYRVMDLK